MLDPWPTQVEVATSAVPLARHSVPLRRLPRGLATRENMEPQGDDLLADVDAWLRGLEASALFQAPASASRASCEAPAGDSQRLRPGRPRGKRTPRLSQLRVEPMNSTQRRKEELSFLRLKAAELERELAALGRRRIPADGRRGRESGEEARSAWRSIAKRQGAERARAERENARLLDKMQRHVRLRRAVERLLSECEEDAKEEMVDRWETPECHSRAELAKLRRLLQSVESHCPLLHVVLASNSSIGDGGYIKLNESVSGEISMEARYNQVVPFPYEVTGSVGWRGIQQGKLNFFPDVTVVDTTPDTAMVKMKAVLPSIVVTPATVYQAIKWLRDGDGEYVVWEMTASTDSSTDMPDGTLGSELREFAMLTAIKSSDRTTTHFACDQKGKLSECIAAAYHEMHLHAHQVLENLLLDATATV